MKIRSLENISMVLVGTKHPGNLGAVARAMNNMGLSDLRLVDPQCRMDEEAFRLAKAGTSILEKASVYDSTMNAISDLHLVVGTSAKAGGYRAQALAPRAAAGKILDRSDAQRAGIMFGPEDTGLVDEDLCHCQILLRIPTASRASSLNLAQAVLVVCYDLFMASLDREPARAPKLASAEQLEQMYLQLEHALLEIGFLQPQNARHMMFGLRRLFGRTGLEVSDVGILRGIARQIAWYGSRGGKLPPD